MNAVVAWQHYWAATNANDTLREYAVLPPPPSPSSPKCDRDRVGLSARREMYGPDLCQHPRLALWVLAQVEVCTRARGATAADRKRAQPSIWAHAAAGPCRQVRGVLFLRPARRTPLPLPSNRFFAVRSDVLILWTQTQLHGARKRERARAPLPSTIARIPSQLPPMTRMVSFSQLDLTACSIPHTRCGRPRDVSEVAQVGYHIFLGKSNFLGLGCLIWFRARSKSTKIAHFPPCLGGLPGFECSPVPKKSPTHFPKTRSFPKKELGTGLKKL